MTNWFGFMGPSLNERVAGVDMFRREQKLSHYHIDYVLIAIIPLYISMCSDFVFSLFSFYFVVKYASLYSYLSSSFLKKLFKFIK